MSTYAFSNCIPNDLWISLVS